MSSEELEIRVTPNFLWDTCELGRAVYASYTEIGDSILAPLHGLEDHHWRAYSERLFESLESADEFHPDMILSGYRGPMPDSVSNMSGDTISTFTVPEEYIIEYIRVAGRIASKRIDDGEDTEAIERVIQHIAEEVDSSQVEDEANTTLEFIKDEKPQSLIEQFKEWIESRTD
jgi:hypothetical protein